MTWSHRARMTLVLATLLASNAGILAAPRGADARPTARSTAATPREVAIREELDLTDRRIAEAREAAGSDPREAVAGLIRNAVEQQATARQLLAGGRPARAGAATRIACRLADRALEALSAPRAGRETIEISLRRAESRLSLARSWATARPRNRGVVRRLGRVAEMIDAAWEAVRADRTSFALKQLAGVRQIFSEFEAQGFSPESSPPASPAYDEFSSSLLFRLTREFVSAAEQDARPRAAGSLEPSQRLLAVAGDVTATAEARRRALADAGRGALRVVEEQPGTPTTPLIAALIRLTAARNDALPPAAPETRGETDGRVVVQRELRAAMKHLDKGRSGRAWAEAVAAFRHLVTLEGTVR